MKNTAQALQAVQVLVSHICSSCVTNARRAKQWIVGNKRSSSTPSTDNSEFRFGSHSDTAPYSNATPMGSGSTGGAGYGNKTGEMSGPGHDSVLGKVVEKVGGMMKNGKIEDKGRVMREKEGFGGSVSGNE